MVDAHTHLDVCKQPDDELVEGALADGVTKLVTVGTDAASNRRALEAAERYPGVYAAIGHHPNDASGFDDHDLADLAELAAHPRCVAIGETGLDYYRDHAPREDQFRAFLAQIELARQLHKPVMIHTRDADEDTIRTLIVQAPDLDVILHCFSMPTRIDECLAQPRWWISFAGPVTYPKNIELRQAVLKVPAGRLLVETDAPYLAPQPVRGKPNVPANVVRTAELVAIERRVPYDQLEREVEAAAAAVYGW